MGIIKVEDIMGYVVDQECVCCDCTNKSEETEATQNEIITRYDVENNDELYFCDRCNEQIV